MRGVQRGPFHDLPPEVAILSAVAFAVALGFGIVAPAIPAFARQFDVSVAVAASVISVFALMRVAGALPAGRLVDRFGEPGVMAAGIAVVATSSILAGFSQSFVELMVLRGSGGVGSAMFSISAQALLLGTVPSSQRGRASGLFSGGFLLGGISGPAVGGLVAAWSLAAIIVTGASTTFVPPRFKERYISAARSAGRSRGSAASSSSRWLTTSPVSLCPLLGPGLPGIRPASPSSCSAALAV